MGPRGGLDGCVKSRPPPGFDPRAVQPVASRYTDYGIPAHSATCRQGFRWRSWSISWYTRSFVYKDYMTVTKYLGGDSR